MDDLVESILDYIRSDYTDYAVMINGEWVLSQGYSRKAYYTFVPFKEGNYRVLVLAKSFHKNIPYEDTTISSSRPLFNPSHGIPNALYW